MFRRRRAGRRGVGHVPRMSGARRRGRRYHLTGVHLFPVPAIHVCLATALTLAENWTVFLLVITAVSGWEQMSRSLLSSSDDWRLHHLTFTALGRLTLFWVSYCYLDLFKPLRYCVCTFVCNDNNNNNRLYVLSLPVSPLQSVIFSFT